VALEPNAHPNTTLRQVPSSLVHRPPSSTVQLLFALRNGSKLLGIKLNIADGPFDAYGKLIEQKRGWPVSRRVLQSLTAATGDVALIGVRLTAIRSKMFWCILLAR